MQSINEMYWKGCLCYWLLQKCVTFTFIVVLFDVHRRSSRIHSTMIRGLTTYGLLRVMEMRMIFEKFMRGPLQIFRHHRFDVYTKITVALLYGVVDLNWMLTRHIFKQSAKSADTYCWHWFIPHLWCIGPPALPSLPVISCCFSFLHICICFLIT